MDSKALVAVAEPEGWRKKIRDAAAEQNLEKRRAALKRLAENADVEHLPVQRVTMLATRLRDVQAEAAIAILHPGIDMIGAEHARVRGQALRRHHFVLRQLNVVVADTIHRICAIVRSLIRCRIGIRTSLTKTA